MGSIVYNVDIFITLFNKSHDLIISKEFVECADKQLTDIFERDTGLKVNKSICLSTAWRPVFFYHKGDISKFASEIWVNNQNTPITIAWKSSSGRIYNIDDTDIDCADIEFWFEGFDALLYNRQMFPKFTLPFKLKNLNYELSIDRLNMECTIEMTLKQAEIFNAAAIIKTVDQFIEDYNTTSEKKDRKYGVVHSWKTALEDTRLIYEIDTGFTGADFLKKILMFLSELDVFEKVKVM